MNGKKEISEAGPWWLSGWQWARLAGIVLFAVGVLTQAVTWTCVAVGVGEGALGWGIWWVKGLLANLWMVLDDEDGEDLFRFGLIVALAVHLFFLIVTGFRLTHRLPVLLCVGWGLAVGPALMLSMAFAITRTMELLGISGFDLTPLIIGGVGVLLLPPAMLWAWWDTQRTGWWLIRVQVWLLGVCTIPAVTGVLLGVTGRRRWDAAMADDVVFLLDFSSGMLFLMSLLAVGMLFRVYRRRMRSDGLTPECIKCGYDLRGSIAGGQAKCPECGSEVSPTQRERFGSAVEIKAVAD